MTAAFGRLPPSQVRVLKHLALYCGMGGNILLPKALRRAVPGLWRRGLIEVWYRQVPDQSPSLNGPFFGLSLDGRRMVSLIFHPLNQEIAGEAHGER